MAQQLGAPKFTDSNPELLDRKAAHSKQGPLPGELPTTATYLGSTSRAETLKPPHSPMVLHIQD